MDDTSDRPQADKAPPLPAQLLVERVKEFSDDDLHTLCEATSAAIIDGGGFGWLNPPGRMALETYFRGVLLVPERELFVARLDGSAVGSFFSGVSMRIICAGTGKATVRLIAKADRTPPLSAR